MQISIRADVLRFDNKAFDAAMNKAMEELFAKATRAFLIAATRQIEVRTGFLRGAFGPLEDIVGTFENGLVKPRKPLGKIGSRPGRDTASVGRRLIQARRIQERLLKRITKFRERERARLQLIRDKGKLKLGGKKSETRRKAAVAKAFRDRRRELTKIRTQAITERRKRQTLIKRAIRNQTQIDQLVTEFEKRTKSKLAKRLGDSRKQEMLILEALEERRERAFQRALKGLRQQYTGKITTADVLKPGVSKHKFKLGKRRIKTGGKISGEEYARRLETLRTSFEGKSAAIKRVEARIRTIDSEATSGVNKQRIDRLRKRLQKKYKDSLSRSALEARVRSAGLRLIKAKSGEASAGTSFLALLEEQEKIRRKKQRYTTQNPFRNLRSKEGEQRLNFVVKTQNGRVRGQTLAGKFNLREGEKSKGQPFKLVEFYYPETGGKVLKTPRTGRRFSTVPSKIITRTKSDKKDNSVVFQQLLAAKRAAGIKVDDNLKRAARELVDPVGSYQFNFGVNISYLRAHAPLAFSSGIAAFNQVIASGLIKAVPDFVSFLYKEIHGISGTTVTSNVKR